MYNIRQESGRKRLEVKDVSPKNSVKIPHQRMVKLKGSGVMRPLKNGEKHSTSIGKKYQINLNLIKESSTER